MINKYTIGAKPVLTAKEKKLCIYAVRFTNGIITVGTIVYLTLLGMVCIYILLNTNPLIVLGAFVLMLMVGLLIYGIINSQDE